ncbi:unnamed protein product [Rotaria sp. Silwood1]|nr:unnamed protein product [Rotaria sp. Silwood1]CAF4951583.1 unnamed protein product [Rotaria sp. Silwood1]
MNQQSWTDPKEAIINPDVLASMIQQFNEHPDYSENMGGNGSPVISGEHQEVARDDTPNKRRRNLIDGDISNTQSPKNRRIRGSFGSKDQGVRGPMVIRNQTYVHRNEPNINKNNNQHHKQHSASLNNTKNNNDINEDFYHYKVNDQSLTYSIDTHLPPIIFECRPKIKEKDAAKKLVMLFFKEIEKDFRQKHPNHRRAIGFDHWWQNSDGARILGEIKDVDLFIYLCDAKRYPKQLNNINILPDPPKRLPPRNTVVVKFVKNDIDIDEFRIDIKERYKSIFTVENMMGTMRSNSRHIRMDFSDINDYESILNSGVISIQGQLYDVDEYLPAPKILICSKCNEPGHIKKQCQLSIEKCRRCGGDRNDGSDHKICLIKCQHCGNKEHCSNDYRCPSLLDFRRQIVAELRRRPDCLPPQAQFFIPVDCRPKGNYTRKLNNPATVRQQRNFTPQLNINSMNEWPELPVRHFNTEQIVNSTVKEIEELKQKYIENQQKIEQRFHEQLKSIQHGWTAIQNQVLTQNEMITTTCNIIEDILFDSCQTINNMVGNIVNEIRIKSTTEEEQKTFLIIEEHLKLMTTKLIDKKQAYNQFQEQLKILMFQQRTAAASIMDSLFSKTNV